MLKLEFNLPALRNIILIEYRSFIRSEEDKKITEEIRKQTRLGKPLSDGGSFKTLSENLGRSLSFRPKGRPWKNR